MEGVGPVATVNWHYVDTKKRKRIRPEPGKRITVKEGDAYIPRDNYLLVTRLPNFLTSDFEELLQLDPSVWPHLLVFEGNHGLGTRAAELLVGSAGLKALEEAKSELRGATEFQVLFRVTGIELTDKGFHRFHKIELVEDGVARLNSLEIKLY